MDFEDVFKFAANFQGLSTFFILTNTLGMSHEKIMKDRRILEVFTQILSWVLSDSKKYNISKQTTGEISRIRDALGDALKVKDEKTRLRKFIGLYELVEKRRLIWEDRIRSELRKIKFVTLSTGTMLNPEKLSSGPECFFDESIWKELSGLERADLQDGCRCILLQAWTPAAMIIMRTIESAFRSYYHKLTGSDPKKKGWGELLHELKDEPNADKKLLGYFDYLKDIRNKLEHPDARFTQSEAEDTFTQAIHIMKQIHS